jgi:hypothetical protein
VFQDLCDSSDSRGGQVGGVTVDVTVAPLFRWSEILPGTTDSLAVQWLRKTYCCPWACGEGFPPGNLGVAWRVGIWARRIRR